MARRAGSIALVLICSAGCGSRKEPPPPPTKTERTPAPDEAVPAPAPAPSPTIDPPLLAIPEDAPTNASSCEQREAFARAAMHELVEAAGGTCNADAECTAALADTRCFGACRAAIASARIVDFRRAQEAIDERVCTGYLSDGCRYVGPRCIEQEAFCEQGHCALRPLPP
ncbi:hypothetical protein [Paraliomyxa miuraensis]|uniref:hypothetical protein n=1 Tax=Paraliomyxa miuraensis TaxID=376150 RepID=UPI0022545D1D|nr:hypothetical protein [Paraliomyxa miuraensis]MCX4242681.1 hypothetical protein [Paraliomyxa miuraensis]